MIQPRYPIYVISKGRFERCLTPEFLRADGVPFRLVVEPQEAEQYAKQFGRDVLEVLPFSNLGLGSIPARNWVKDHATASGAARHWILDDNCRGVARLYKKHRIACQAGPAFACAEDFVDRYENVAVAGLNYKSFGFYNMPPFHLNVHVYSCCLILNSIPNRWRGRYNEDTDLCLQVLADGWCTVLINAFLIDKMTTMTMKGGNTDQLYKGDGRLRMSRALERIWPGGVVKTGRRFHRPQHVVKDNWQRFDTPLKLKPGIKLDQLHPNEYGLELKAIREVKSPQLRDLLAASISKRPEVPSGTIARRKKGRA